MDTDAKSFSSVQSLLMPFYRFTFGKWCGYEDKVYFRSIHSISLSDQSHQTHLQTRLVHPFFVLAVFGTNRRKESYACGRSNWIPVWSRHITFFTVTQLLIRTPEFSVQTEEKSLRRRTYLRSESKQFLANRVKHPQFCRIPNHHIIDVDYQQKSGSGRPDWLRMISEIFFDRNHFS